VASSRISHGGSRKKVYHSAAYFLEDKLGLIMDLIRSTVDQGAQHLNRFLSVEHSPPKPLLNKRGLGFGSKKLF